jgi:purine catabolism regulator
MPLVTVHDAIRLALPVSTRVVAGHGALSRTISWTALARAVAPLFTDLRGGEFAMVSVPALRDIDPPLSLSMLVQRLANVPVAALAVVGVVDAEAARVAEDLQLPLLQLTTDIDIRDVDRELQRLLSDFDAQLDRRAAQIAMELGEQSLAGHGLAAMVTLLAQRTLRSVAIFSAKHDLLVYEGDPDLQLLIRHMQVRTGSVQLAGYDGWGLELHAGDQTLGYVIIMGKGLTESDRATIKRAAMALALELTKSQAITVAEARFRGNLIEQILSGQLTDALVIQQRGRELGFDLRSPHAAMLITVEAAQVTALQQSFAEIHDALGMHVPWIAHQLGVLCLIPQHPDAPLALPAIQSLYDAVAKRFPRVKAGVGRIVTHVSEWGRTVQEAEQTLRLPTQGPRQLLVYDQLGVYQLLLPMSANADVHAFYYRQLGRLLEYDREQRGELLHTLEAYFDCSGNLARTSERIHIHRNTLLYRLSRVAQICGVDLDDHEVRLSMWLALKLHHMLKTAEEA